MYRPKTHQLEEGFTVEEMQSGDSGYPWVTMGR